MFLAMQTSNARQKVYKAIVQARPPQLDFILAATQVIILFPTVELFL